jgi:hypothetical protein
VIKKTTNQNKKRCYPKSLNRVGIKSLNIKFMKTKKKLRWNLTTKISTFLTLAVLVLFASCKEELENALESKKSSERVEATNGYPFLTKTEYSSPNTEVHYIIYSNTNFGGESAVGGNTVRDQLLTYTYINNSTTMESGQIKTANIFKSYVVAPYTTMYIKYQNSVTGVIYTKTVDNGDSKTAKYVSSFQKNAYFDYVIQILSSQSNPNTLIDNELCGFLFDHYTVGVNQPFTSGRIPVFQSSPLTVTNLKAWGWNDNCSSVWFNPGGPCSAIARSREEYKIYHLCKPFCFR